ncbi:ATP-binding protein [Desulfothermus sp.]
MNITNKEPDILLEVPAQVYYLPAIGHFAKAIFTKHPYFEKCSEEVIYFLELIIYESAANVIKHAYPEGVVGKLKVKIWLDSKKVILNVIDFGKGFDPHHLPEPDPTSPTEGGMGVFLIKKIAKKFSYFFSQEENGNILHLEIGI